MSVPRMVVVVDDHALFRDGVRSRLGGRRRSPERPGTVHQALAMIRATRPDVVLLDVHMPGGGGLAVPERARLELPDVPFWRCRCPMRPRT